MLKDARVDARFLEGLPLGVLILDKDLNLAAGNRLALELLHIPVENLLTESLPALLEKTPLSAMLDVNAGDVTGTRKLHADLHGRTLQITVCRPGFPATGDGDIVITVNDITRFKQMEAVKSEFISVLLHKIRNPLTSVKTSLSMLKSGMVPGMPPEAREILEISHDEVNRLNGLLGDLRNTFAVETGLLGKELEIEPVEVMKVIHRAIAETLPWLSGGEAEKVRFSIEGDLSSRFDGDFEKARQALFYLFKNAAQYSDRKKKIRIVVRRDPEQIALSIQDKGIGIPDKALPFVFDKFFRADNVFETGVEGNGLGLYIARAFIESMNGNLFFESREKQGTTFFASFPRSR